MPAPKRDITPWELTTNGARQHPGDGDPGLVEAPAGRKMSRIPDFWITEEDICSIDTFGVLR